MNIDRAEGDLDEILCLQHQSKFNTHRARVDVKPLCPTVATEVLRSQRPKYFENIRSEGSWPKTF